jgi:hypothetical protein
LTGLFFWIWGSHISRHLESILTFCHPRITTGAFEELSQDHEHQAMGAWALRGTIFKAAICFYRGKLGLYPTSF